MIKKFLVLIGSSSFVAPILFAEPVKLDAFPIKTSLSSEVSELGKITYKLFKKAGDDWVIDDPGATFPFGDCTACIRGMALGTIVMNGNPDNLKQLGGYAISFSFLGPSLSSLVLKLGSSAALNRVFSVGPKVANVGLTLNETQIPVNAGQPFEFIFTGESVNPFDLESVAPNTDIGPTTYKLFVQVQD